MPRVCAMDEAVQAAQFRALVDAHFAFIWRSLRGLGVQHAAVDDAAQQVFLVALQKLGALTSGSERSFLFGTALKVAATARRAQGRSREVQDDEAVEGSADAAPDPEEASSLKEERAMLDAILSGMPIELSTVFVLFELEGLTMAEIAGILDLAPGTVASRLRRAREQFRAETRRALAGARSRGRQTVSGGAR